MTCERAGERRARGYHPGGCNRFARIAYHVPEDSHPSSTCATPSSSWCGATTVATAWTPGCAFAIATPRATVAIMSRSFRPSPNAAVSVNGLPLGVSVEVQLVLEVRD